MVEDMTGPFNHGKSKSISFKSVTSNRIENIDEKNGKIFGEVHITIAEYPDKDGNYFLECRTQITDLDPSKKVNKYKDDPRILALKNYLRENLKTYQHLIHVRHSFLESD
jgi:hypothetical protein